MALEFKYLGKELKRVASNVSREQTRFLVLGGKRMEGLMKRRIFNEGQDSEEKKIGDYKSTYWEKVRQRKGRQTSKVDLQYSGSLLTSMKTVEDGKEVVLAIVNDLDYKKAKGNEERRNKEIFLPTKKEVRRVENYVSDLIAEELAKEILNL